uniref:Secreted protein n=1 Tax=Achlya hypogyna TaxID=1202772 RepID=A0A0A7CP42_ACHHY|nr:secreted protein [Achlya hypogyna]
MLGLLLLGAVGADETCTPIAAKSLAFCSMAPTSFPRLVDYVAVTNEADPNGFAADAEAAVYYANIDKVNPPVYILDRFGCSTKYSLYNCDDCRDAYKYWVCAVKFQRCGGPSATATAVCPTIANSCDPFRTRVQATPLRLHHHVGYTCLSICEDVIRKCPYVLSFNCPAEETEYFSTDIANCNHLVPPALPTPLIDPQDRAVHPDNPSLAWPGTFASS